MKPRVSFLSFKSAAFCLGLFLQAAQTFAGSPATRKTAVGEGPVTQSVFVLPRLQAEGRDPFFPRSVSVYTRYNAVPQTNQTVVVAAELRLNGISGSIDRRLAIINNKTFEVGEEADVISGPDKVRIRCLEIKDDTVIVQFVSGGTRRELHLRRGI